MIAGIDFAYIATVLPRIGSVVPFTVFIVLVSGVLGLILAIAVAAIRIRKIPVLYPVSGVYLSFFRSTPGIIHLFLVYYGLPIILRLAGIEIGDWNRAVFCILALVLFNGAHMSEYLRPAYLSLDAGEREAAASVGMTGFQTFRRISIPQILPMILPGVGTTVIELIKDTSLLFVIGLADIMGRAKNLIATDYGVKKLEVYISVGLVYWALISVTALAFRTLEKKVNHV
jgi:L-cystine transport system permease protein